MQVMQAARSANMPPMPFPYPFAAQASSPKGSSRVIRIAMTLRLKLGTRGSHLALTQARLVRAALAHAHGWDEDAIEIIVIKTSGDRIQNRPLADIGGKALWTKELEKALIDRRIDIAVHSMKDVETQRPQTICIAALVPRADPRDVFLSSVAHPQDLPRGARLGTCSPRRAAQMLALRPDLVIHPLRGNVETRLAKLDAGQVDATILARAGLERLGHGDTGTLLDTDVMLPAVAQGAIGIEARADDDQVRSWMQRINDDATYDAICCERALLDKLGGSCHSPVGAFARIDADQMILQSEILSPDGSVRIRKTCRGDRRDAVAMGHDMARQLLDRAPNDLRACFGG